MTTHTDLINATGVRVLIDLTDVSAYVKSETLMIKDTGGIEVETCTFAMRPLSPAVTLEWKDCQVIADLDDASSVYLFAGFVTRPVSAFADNGVETEIEVRAEGYKTLLARSKPFSDYYKGVTVEAMVESMLFDAELFDFTCNTQSEMVSYWDISIDEPIAKNLDRFCKERNWAWRVGYNKSVTIGPESADVFGDWGIAEAQYVNMSTLYPVENIALESDASMIANAVMVIGGVATSDIVTEEFTGDGTTENFFLSARPIGSIISIMVDELYVSWGTIGYHSCAERDCLVHFESGYVRFCTPPLTGEVIRIQYNYQFPYTYTGYDSASQTLYGQTLWTLVEAPWINDDTSAAAYVAAIFEQAATAPKRTSCDVRRIGPRAGQSIACRFPSLGVGTPSASETMLIESIGTTIDGRYPVQTLRLGPATERLLGTLETLLGGGTSSAKVASSSETSDHGLLTGLADDDHTQYLLATGTRAGASSQAQAFTNGIVGPTWRPASDSTTALQMQDAAGNAVVTVDTTNKKTTLNTTSTPAALGAELVTNGAFATGASWTFGDGWAHDGAALTAKHTAGSVAVLSQNVSAVNGGTYLVTFDIKTRTAGTVYVSLGGLWGAIYYGASGSFAPLMTAGASGEITFTPSTDFDGSIDNVSVKRVTATGSVMDLALSGSTTASVRSSSKGLGIGDSSLAYLSSDSYGGNAAFGGWAMKSMVSGWRNLAFGDAALLQATTSQYATGIGYGALQNLEAGGNSVAIGAMALNSSKDSWNNVAIGAGALANLDGRNPDGNAGNNVAIGASALAKQTVGYGNTAIGPYYELGELTTGVDNIAIGSRNSSLTTGTGNILIGSIAGYSVQTGTGNTLIGGYAGFGITGTSGGNTAIGQFSGGRADGNDNLYLGNRAGYSTWSTAKQANRNTMVGAYTGYTAISSDSVFLGHRAGYYETGDGRLFVDNQSRTDEATSRVSSLIYGEFNATVASQLLRTNGVFQSMMTDSATNAATTQLKITHNTSGTVDNGFGSRVLWELKSSTTADQTAAALDVLWTEKTHASRTSKLAASIVQSGTLYELASLGGSGAIFNDGGESWSDFRVEGDTATHLLFVDASADAVGIGTSAPAVRFHVSQTSGDAGIREIARITHNSSGTPSKGFGVSLALALETTTTENMVAGLVAAIWNSATHASRAGDLIGYAADASGEREGWRVRASGSAPMFSLFGATPILRPTTSHAAASFTANSGTAVNDASTFDGYTLKQVVKVLRDIGILT